MPHLKGWLEYYGLDNLDITNALSASTFTASGQIEGDNVKLGNGSLNLHANDVSLDDESVTKISPNANNGLLLVQVESDSEDEWLLAHFKVSSTAAMTSISKTSNVAVTSGSSDLSGTTGTDGNLTVHADSGDNEIHIENQLTTAGSRTINYLIITA